MLRLMIIAPSHYCEKARWALQRAGMAFEEEAHLPLFHLLAHRKIKAGRTTPILVTPEGVIDDSTKILHYVETKASADRKLYPTDPELRKEVDELEEKFDEKFGPHTRRYAYFHLLPIKPLVIEAFAYRAPKTEYALFKLLFPLIRAGMQKSMNIHARSAERSKAQVDAIFAEISSRLADGRRYLVGGRFTAADLTFASLGAPMVLPPEYGTPLPSLAALPPALQREIEALRQTPAGQFILRMYREERRT